MPLTTCTTGRRIQGFSVVELMVGVTVGLIALLAITQTLGTFEGQKRTTTAAADAQENGLLGLFFIEQDLRQAAAGFTHAEAFGCQNFFSFYRETSSGTGAPIASFNTTPVSIVDGGVGHPDTVVVRTGSRFTGSIPTRLTASMDSPADPIEVERVYDFTDQDLVMLVSPGGVNCTLTRITAVDMPSRKLTRAPGETPEYNPVASYLTANSWPAYVMNSSVFRVGTTAGGGVTSRSYSVNANNQLQVASAVSGAAAAAQVVSSEIVDLQAQYGVAPAGSQQINDWVDATGGWAAPSVADRQRIKAVRVVIVARSAKRDGAIVANTCTSNSGVVNYGPCAWSDSTADPAPLVDLRAAAGDTEWQHYRYKAYQTVIPMRNVMWSNL